MIRRFGSLRSSLQGKAPRSKISTDGEGQENKRLANGDEATIISTVREVLKSDPTILVTKPIKAAGRSCTTSNAERLAAKPSVDIGTLSICEDAPAVISETTWQKALENSPETVGESEVCYESEKKIFTEDTSSYLVGGWRCDEEAAKAANFVGNAYYYELNQTRVHPGIEGQYTIVYTRPVGWNFDPENDTMSKVFAPDERRKIVIKTVAPQGDSVEATTLQRILKLNGRGEKFAVGALNLTSIGGWTFICDQISKDMITKNPAKATLKILNLNYGTYGDDEISQLLMTGARDTGSTIAFGFKVTQYANHNFDDNIGYHFLEMELACRDPDTGKLGRQLIIAVKMPPRRPAGDHWGPSVSTLDQNLDSEHVRRFFSKRTMDKDNPEPAHLFYYEENDIYEGPRELPSWTIKAIDCGYKISSFDPDLLERHLLRQNEPLMELERIVAWLKPFIVKPEKSNDPRLWNAYSYAANRLEGMQWERYFREQASGLWDGAKSWRIPDIASS